MTGNPREEILVQLKKTAPASSGIRKSAESDVIPGAIEKFVQNIEQNAARAFHVNDYTEAGDVITEYLKDRNVKSLLMVDDDRLDYSTMKRIIDDLPGECTVASELDNELFREKAFSCDASITYCDLGIEESGSLVVFHRPGAPRLASIAPKVHVAVVHAGSIISNIGGLVTRLTGNTLPSACTIISGVSRTADINLNVTLGMHGPMDMAVVIIGGMKE